MDCIMVSCAHGSYMSIYTQNSTAVVIGWTVHNSLTIDREMFCLDRFMNEAELSAHMIARQKTLRAQAAAQHVYRKAM